MALNKNIKKGGAVVAIWLLVVVVVSVLANLKSLDRLQLQTSAALYQTRASSHPILIVGVDQQTTDQLGQTATWTRDMYARAIENISKYQPAAIGLDYTFISKGKVIPTGKLNEILASDGNIQDQVAEIKKVVGTDLTQYDQALADEISSNKKLVLVYPPIGNFPKEVISDGKTKLNEPFPAFKPEEKNRIGYANMLTELDGSVRRYIPAMAGAEQYPSFALAMIATYFGEKNIQIGEFSADGLDVKLAGQNLHIPLQDYQFLINFSSKLVKDGEAEMENKNNPNFKFVHFVDAYNGDFSAIDPNWMKGKIVLIGPYVQTTDNYKVPIDNVYRMYGVLIHAEAIQTILDQAWLREMNNNEVVIVSAIVALVGLALIFFLRIGWALIGLAAIEVIYTVVIGPWAFRNGLIVNLIYPPLAVVLAAIVGYAYRYVTEFGQKTRAAAALGQYVNAGVAEQVLESAKVGVEKVGKKAEITVIFTDIRSFTTISEGLQPQSLVAVLNEYFEVMANEVVKNGGTVDKYEGDALMAFFEGPEHELRAARAALGMRRALPGLMEKWRTDPPLPGGEKKPEIDFRVGLSSGEAIVGNIGSTQHIQYTVIGDIVNLGSRLESANKKYQTNVMAAEATYEAIKNQFQCRYLDNIEVKGKSRPVKIYQLICEAGQLPQEDQEMIAAYNVGIQLYFDRKFAEAKEHFEKNVLSKWPRDYLSNVYAARAQKCVMFPPDADWDFVFKMESK